MEGSQHSPGGQGTAPGRQRAQLAPAPAGFFTRIAVTVLEITAVTLLGMGVQWLATEPLAPEKFTMAVALTTALIRILTETVWGSSPGKWLTGIRVRFPGEQRWMRLPQATLRNIWLWLVPVDILTGQSGATVWGFASLVGLTIILGPDRRSVTDLLAGAFVIDPNAPRRVADPVDHVSPRRALAWMVDMTLAGLAGLLLDSWLTWSWWAAGLLVLAVLKVGAELASLPTPGKALTGLRITYPPGLRPIRVLARNLWLLPAILLAAGVHHPVFLIEGFIAMTFLYLPGQRSATDHLAQASVTR